MDLIIAQARAAHNAVAPCRARVGSNEATFRRICYSLIGAAAIIGLPALDGMLR